MNVILCGFMGCGKSTIGKALSKKTNYKFIDLDEYIENSQKMRISDIFDKFGEDEFRKIESQSINEICKLENHIISLGGGAVLNPKNVEILKTCGKLFFLNISANEVYNRLKDDTTRPLLQTDDKLGAISNLLNKRLPIYTSVADVVIDVDNKNIEEIADELLKNL